MFFTADGTDAHRLTLMGFLFICVILFIRVEPKVRICGKRTYDSLIVRGFSI
jgi:hypothetical protein